MYVSMHACMHSIHISVYYIFTKYRIMVYYFILYYIISYHIIVLLYSTICDIVYTICHVIYAYLISYHILHVRCDMFAALYIIYSNCICINIPSGVPRQRSPGWSACPRCARAPDLGHPAALGQSSFAQDVNQKKTCWCVSRREWMGMGECDYH